MQERVTRKKVQDWVKDFGLEHQRHPVDGDSGLEWGLLVSGQAFKAIVAQRTVDFNYLAIQASIAVSEEHQAVLRSLSDDARATFLYDLRLALHQRAIGHAIEYELDESGDATTFPARVTVGTNLVEPPMARADFFRANHIVQTGATIVALMFQKMAHRRSWQ